MGILGSARKNHQWVQVAPIWLLNRHTTLKCLSKPLLTTLSKKVSKLSSILDNLRELDNSSRQPVNEMSIRFAGIDFSPLSYMTLQDFLTSLRGARLLPNPFSDETPWDGVVFSC